MSMSFEIIPRSESMFFRFFMSVLFTALMSGVMVRYRARNVVAPMMSFIHSGVPVRVVVR